MGRTGIEAFYEINDDIPSKCDGKIKSGVTVFATSISQNSRCLRSGDKLLYKVSYPTKLSETYLVDYISRLFKVRMNIPKI